MKRSDFVKKGEEKKYSMDSIKNEPDYDSPLLDIINYLFDEIYKANSSCKISVLSSAKDLQTKMINSITFTADYCLEKIKLLKLKYLKAYEKNNLVWSESGNNITMSLSNKKNDATSQPTTTTQSGDLYDVYGQVTKTLMGINEDTHLTKDINRIKRLIK